LFDNGANRTVLHPRRESVEKRGAAIPTPNPRKPTKGVKPLSDKNARPPPALGPEVMAVIGRHLRAMYIDIIAEGGAGAVCRNPTEAGRGKQRGLEKRPDAAYHLTLAKGKPNMAAPSRKHRLSTEQRRALAMLADAGRNGVTAAIMLANGLKTKMLARLDREGLATAMIAERVKDGGKIIEVVRFRITAAGRRALED
jgi:hypothetical protein